MADHATPGHPKQATALPQEATEPFPIVTPTSSNPLLGCFLRPSATSRRCLVHRLIILRKGPSHSDETSAHALKGSPRASQAGLQGVRTADAHLSLPGDWANQPLAVGFAQGPGWTGRASGHFLPSRYPRRGLSNLEREGVCVSLTWTGKLVGRGLASTPETGR